jgi:hypothetical protein
VGPERIDTRKGKPRAERKGVVVVVGGEEANRKSISKVKTSSIETRKGKSGFRAGKKK